jgi:hypothetical protein
MKSLNQYPADQFLEDTIDIDLTNLSTRDFLHVFWIYATTQTLASKKSTVLAYIEKMKQS